MLNNLLKRKLRDDYPDDRCWNDIAEYGEGIKRFWLKKCLTMSKEEIKKELKGDKE